MFSHMMIGSNDIDRSKKFYDATFKAMGGQEGRKDDKGRLIYMHNGGTAIEDPPGIRSGGMGDLYLAYLRDPDGNKLCALHRMQ